MKRKHLDVYVYGELREETDKKTKQRLTDQEKDETEMEEEEKAENEEETSVSRINESSVFFLLP